MLAHLHEPDAFPHLTRLTLLFAALVLLSYAVFEALPPRRMTP